MNIRRFTLLFLALSGSFTYSAAQVGCEYRLELYDAYGDGWNGGFLTVTVNDKSENFPFTDDFVLILPVQVMDGDSLQISFTVGLFSYEASFRVFDADGAELFYSGADPDAGLLFVTQVSCPSCPQLSATGISVEKIRHNQAMVRWIINDPNATFLLKYGPAGSSPDAAAAIEITNTDRYQLTALEQHRRYDVYLQAVCLNGDTTNQIGPFTFETLWARDVGIAALIAPVSDCDLPADGDVVLTLKNFGGAPQTLIPFNYSIDGVPGLVNQPNDGLFTGILSHDSTCTVRFDATYDFSNPRIYHVKVWTELEGDSNPANDTLDATIIHTPLIQEFPYRMDFESGSGGWMLDPGSESASLELGQPNGNVIKTAHSGQYAWVTNLDGNYNNRERSMLLSPCLDFSSLDTDPELSFSLWVSTEPTFDGAWVEVSVAGGPWTKLGLVGNIGTFWYNTIDDINGHWWTGDNIFGGWRRVRYPLSDLAGAEDVRIRIVFRSDEAVVREGIGIDDIFIAPPLNNNLVAREVTYLEELECGSEATKVKLTFRNEGATTQQNFRLACRVNNGPVVIEDYSMPLAPEAEASYTFATPFNSSLPAEYHIRAWTELAGEEYPANDTVFQIYSTTGPGIPYLQNFETGKIPADWTVDTDGAVENSHNSGSSVLFDNLWAEDTSFQAITPLLGPIETGDTLFFSYRFVNFMGFGTQPTALGPGAALRIAISEDCGASFQEVQVIDANNHQIKNTMQLIRLPLEAYIGQWIKIRFRAVWGTGDYYCDLDNINVRRCPASLSLQTSVSPPSGSSNNGSIRVEPAAGISPYYYYWSNGARQASLSGLAPGTYQITVSDQQGCTDAVTVALESTVDSREPLSKINSIRLAPNPNAGNSVLDLRLDEAYDVNISIFDARGRLIRQTGLRQVSQINYPVNLINYPDGLYFIRVLVQNEVRTVRLVKANAP